MTPRVNLADLVARRVPLVPREAATLTLAVAREWDRQCMLRGPIGLPHPRAIELTAAGTVVFLVLPRPDGKGDVAALSELLGCLLGIHDTEPRQPIPGGLLITMNGRLGSMELPSATPDGFRAALARFADDTPATLRTVYWRGVTARSRESRLARKGTDAARRPERRATAEQISELRRCIHRLERHAFEQTRKPSWHGRASRLAAGAALIALAVASGVAMTLFQWPGTTAVNPTSTIDTRQAVSRPADPPPAIRVVDTRRAVPATPVRRHEVTVPARRASFRLQVTSDTRAQAERPRASAVFAGGTRGITWMSR